MMYPRDRDGGSHLTGSGIHHSNIPASCLRLSLPVLRLPPPTSLRKPCRLPLKPTGCAIARPAGTRWSPPPSSALVVVVVSPAVDLALRRQRCFLRSF